MSGAPDCADDDDDDDDDDDGDDDDDDDDDDDNDDDVYDYDYDDGDGDDDGDDDYDYDYDDDMMMTNNFWTMTNNDVENWWMKIPVVTSWFSRVWGANSLRSLSLLETSALSLPGRG